MEKIDLNNFVMFLTSEFNWDIRPSWDDKIRKSLIRNNINKWRKFCACSEEELLSIEYFTPVLVNQIIEFLGSRGLHLGMTDRELDDYQDVEYLKRHPEEAAMWISNNENTDLSSNTENNTKAPHYILMCEDNAKKVFTSKESDAKDDFDDEKAYKRALAEILDKKYCSDMEWIRHQVTMIIFTHQNFFIRIFCPFKTRLNRAIKKAEIIMKEYQHNMALRSVVYDKLCHDGIIKEWLGEEDYKHEFRP